MPYGPGVEQLSWATPGRVQGPTGSTSFPGRLGPGSDFPRGRPAIPGDSGPCPRARGFDQLSRVTRALFGGTVVQPVVPGDSGPCPMSRIIDQASWATQAHARALTGLTSCPVRFGPRSVGRRGQPADSCDSGPCPRPCGVKQKSWVTPARVRGPAVSTNRPGTLALGSEGPQRLPAFPGDWGPGPKALEVGQVSRATRDLVGGPAVDQLSRMTWARTRCTAGPTSCPGD